MNAVLEHTTERSGMEEVPFRLSNLEKHSWEEFLESDVHFESGLEYPRFTNPNHSLSDQLILKKEKSRHFFRYL